MIDKQDICEQTKAQLRKYGFSYNDYALKGIIDSWFENKAELIELLSKHPNWSDKDAAIVFKTQIERPQDRKLFEDCFASIYGTIEIIEKMRIINEVMAEDYNLFYKLNSMIDCYGEEFGVKNFYREMYDNSPAVIMRWHENVFRNYSTIRICSAVDGSIAGEELAKILAEFNIKISPTMRTSRALNKFFTTYKAHKHNSFLLTQNSESYDMLFAKLADAINPLLIEYQASLSVNPCDYINMSNGNSWRSCHYPGHEYCAGIWSYMLDDVSMVFSTIDPKFDTSSDKMYNAPKINRQMFFYHNNILAQSRLYPNSNTSINRQFRALIQEIFAQILDKPNLWSIHKGEITKKYLRTAIHALHYPDYEYYGEAYPIVSLRKLSEEEIKEGVCHTSMRIGHVAYCPQCGEEYWGETEYLYCENCGGNSSKIMCSSCEEYFDEEEMYCTNDGDMICELCFQEYYFRCSRCTDIFYGEDRIYIEDDDEYVCEHCAEHRYHQCDYCNDWFHSDIEYIGNCWVCSACLDEHYCTCDECGDYFLNEELKEGEDGKWRCWRCEDCRDLEDAEDEQEEDAEIINLTATATKVGEGTITIPEGWTGRMGQVEHHQRQIERILEEAVISE